MALNLTKNQSVCLTKEAPGLNNVRLGLGWEVASQPLDLDVACFMLGADGKCPNDGYMIFFNQKVSPDQSVVHNGDNRTGSGDGDDETIDIDLSKVGPNINEVSILVTIYGARQKSQNFGSLKSAYIRVINQADNAVIAQYDLDENFPGKYSVQVGSLIRDPVGQWSFQAIGIGYEKELGEVAGVYGLSV
jgi:tellurium resistance protein TerD